MSVNFAALFERSKYGGGGSRPGVSQAERKRLMYQYERFAVGAVGFVLDHDLGFRSHFLQQICQFQSLPKPAAWEVLVEPHNWADLMLTHRTSSRLVVVEFKIGSKLKDHQDPTKPEFHWSTTKAGCPGYGWEIKHFSDHEHLTNRRYVTVQKSASKNTKCRQKELSCIAREWRHLLHSNATDESDLEACLYDSFRHLGVYSFIGRKMSGKKLAAHATEPMALLIGVLQEFDIEFRQKQADANPEALGITMFDKDFPGTRALVKPEGKKVGWFGYESTPAGPRLSVWLYSRAATLRQVQQRMESARKNGDFGGSVEPDLGRLEKHCSARAASAAACPYRYTEPSYPCTIISLPANQSTDDKTWFMAVLKAADAAKE